MKKNQTEDSLSLHLRLQVAGRENITLGPGKAQLLSLVAETGSISEAARRMDMSYMKAWLLLQTMKPLFTATRGGSGRGGAELTETGRQAMKLYRQMEKASRAASQPAWEKLRRLLRKEN